MFTIKITYETGNTFNLSIEVDEIDITWATIEGAKLALECIKQHHHYVKKLDNFNKYRSTTTKEDIIDEMTTYAWFIPDSYEYYLNLPTDGGHVKVRAFWEGYFEVLHSAEIIIADEDGDSLSYDFICHRGIIMSKGMIKFMDDAIRFINLGRGVILPITLEGGYLTVDKNGYVEAWHYKPYYLNGNWINDAEPGVDVYTIPDERLFYDIVDTMIFDLDTLKKVSR